MKKEIVKLLIDSNKININEICYSYRYQQYKEKTPLFIAVEKSNIEIVKLLLNNDDVDINMKYVSKIESCNIEDEKTILHIVVENENIDILNLLLNSSKLDVNSFASYIDYTSDSKMIKILILI